MNQTKQFSILIEGAGTATAISVLKGLNKQKEYNYKTILLDVDDFTSGHYFADKFYKSIQSNNEQYIDYVIDICKKEAVDIYIPIIDYGFEKLSKNRKRFEDNNIYLMIADHDSIEICDDKYKTYNFFKKINILTPKTWLDFNDKIFTSARFPLLLKPRIGGRASLNIYKINNPKELKFYTADRDNYIIQEFIDGVEFTADCLSNLDGTEFIDAVVRERLETKDGVSVKTQMIKKEIAEKIKLSIKKIATTLKLPGAYNIQGFITENGDIFFIEINPRFAGTHVYTIEAGLNSIKNIIDMINDKPLEEVKSSININYNLKMVRYWNEIFIDDNKIWTEGNLLKK